MKTLKVLKYVGFAILGVAPGSRHNHKNDWRKKCQDKYDHSLKEKMAASTAEQA